MHNDYGGNTPKNYGGSPPSNYGGSTPNKYGGNKPHNYGVNASNGHGNIPQNLNHFEESAPSSYRNRDYDNKGTVKKYFF